MPTFEEVQEQIGRLDTASKFLSRKEVRELPNILWEDEHVERLVQGAYNNGSGVLVATNKRLVFVDKGWTKLVVEDFPYDKISSIQYKTGLALGTIMIFASGNNSEIKNVPKDQTRAFADYVRARTTGASDHASEQKPPTSSDDTSGADPLDKLERLGRLREQGVLTEEEFQTQKQKLLED